MSTAPTAPVRRSLWEYFLWAGGLLLLTWAWRGADIRPGALVGGLGNAWKYAQEFFPPDFRDWRVYLAETVVTVHIALWGTLLAVVCAVPCGLISAENVAPAWVRLPMRRFLDACRAINEMVFAMLFIVVVGLGPFAGVLALWVHTTGSLGKLFAEAVEAIDPRPVEGVRAVGASSLEEILYGILPQVLPLWISFALYRLEANIRSASVVGMVGAGGIGVVLYELLRSFQYAQACAVLILIVLLVSLTDWASAALRRRQL